MKRKKYFYLSLHHRHFKKGEVVLLEPEIKTAIIVSDPNSRWRRLMRLLRINKSFDYKLRLL